MKYICIIGSVIFFMGFLSLVLGISIPEALETMLDALIQLSNKIVKAKELSENDIKLMSRASKKKSLFYRFNVLIREMILDLGLNPMTISAGGFVNFLFFLSTGIGIVFGLISKSFAAFCILTVAAFAIILLALFIVTRSLHYNRIIALMEVENMLCTSMSHGVVQAVEYTVDKMPASVRVTFERFLEEQALGIVPALDLLNKRLGKQFDSFCNSAKVLETTGTEGYYRVFEFNIKFNTKTLKLVNSAREKAKAKITDAVISALVLVIALVLFTFAFPTFATFLSSLLGRIFLVAYIMGIICIFLRIQIRINKGVDE